MEETKKNTLVQFVRRRWLWLLLWIFVFFPILSFIAFNLVALSFVYFPGSYNNVRWDQSNNKNQAIILITHGIYDDTSSWVEQLKKTYQAQGTDAQVIDLDWSEYSNNALRCAVNGLRIGEQVGSQLSNREELNQVHLIGHSCGAFVVYGVCQAIKSKKPDVKIQTTYLDPVSIYGVRRSYGVNHFGRCADYAEAYIDTEDGVVGSNQALKYAHTFDVTAIRKQQNNPTSPHNWPTVFYQQLVQSEQQPQLRHQSDLASQQPSGELIPFDGSLVLP